MMEAILNIQNLSKHFEGIVAVDKLSFSIMPGTITGIFGDNGTGKTTLFNLISGFEKPDSGIILFNGNDVTHKSVLKRSRIGMGRLFQTPRIFSEISVMDNLLAAGNNHAAYQLHNYLFKSVTIKNNKMKDTEKAQRILAAFNFTEKASFKAYELSVGEKKLLSLGCLLMNGAKFLLLDEPRAGLSEIMNDKLKNILCKLKADGITLLIIEHNKIMLNEVADTVYELKQGKLNDVTYTKNANY